MILKLFCHWTAAMLQCLILRVVLGHCIFVLRCGFITGSGSGAAAAAVALCSSAPHIVHCTMRINVHCTLLSYIVHCHHTAFVALLLLYRLCPLTKVYKHRAQCRKVAGGGCWYGLGFGSPYCPPRYMAWRKMFGFAWHGIRFCIEIWRKMLGLAERNFYSSI